MTTEDLSYLLCSYLIIADDEISDKELLTLENIYQKPSKLAISEQNMIFSDSENKVSFDFIVNKLVNKSDLQYSKKIISDLYLIAYSDGYLDIREQEFIENLACKLKLNDSELLEIQRTYNNSGGFEIDTSHLSWTSTLKEAFYNLINAVNNQEDNDYELLSGKRFINEIIRISKRSKEDLDVAIEYMNKYNDSLRSISYEIIKKINTIEATKKNNEILNKLLEESRGLKELQKNIDNDLSKNIEILNKKERTINYFTIAFLGRTKTGKSTLHKVVTKNNKDDIGVGALRTTRYNRSWIWENLRIIDTPGIGAPGGKTDTEIAKSIIEEADLVCYVITNDAIQTTEFDFLSDLKERNKPLFIILNVKENLKSKFRLLRFLDNPFKWKDTTGSQNIDGHKQRIIDLIGNNYDPDFLEIIPVQLLAAQLHRTDKNILAKILNNEIAPEEVVESLKKGSNIKEFISKIKNSIYRTGHLKKSQNILDGCSFQIYSIKREFKSKLDSFIEQKRILVEYKTELDNFISNEFYKMRYNIYEEIDNLYNELNNNALTFSEENYEKSKTDLTNKWEEYNSDLYKNFHIKIEEYKAAFINDINDKLKEQFNDINFLTKHLKLDGILYGSKIFNTQYILKQLLNAVSTVLSLYIPSFSFIISIVQDKVKELISKLKSKETKIKEAKEKLKKKLLKLLTSQKTTIEKEITANLLSLRDEIERNTLSIYNSLINSTNEIVKSLETAVENSEQSEGKFNGLFTYRLLQHLNVIDINDTTKNINTICNQFDVSRNYEKSEMTVNSRYSLTQEQIEKISKLIQTKVNFE